MSGPPTVRSAPDPNSTPSSVICPHCAKVLTAEPNFCPACGGDLRGMGGTSDTLDGPAKHTIDGRYKVLEKLGEGGMGAVYKVEHVRMGKIAALKLLRPDHAVDKGLKSRFLQEARVVARLSHPNTVQVFDSGELDDGSLFITMEYVPGKDLAWQLKAHGAMREERVVSIAAQVLASLQEAHEAGVVHRDIKPANVMLVRRRKGEDQVKLLDFGIAKLQEAEGRKSTTGDFVGTPAYMSPEQIRGENVDARSDLYSLGALLFELVTGRALYVGPTPISIITQHGEGHLPRIADAAPQAQVSPAFEAVIRKALAKNPNDRYRDADAMRGALEGLKRDLAPSAPDSTPMPAELAEKMLSREDFDQFERSLRLQRRLAPLVTLLVLVGLAFGGWKLWAARPVSRELATTEREPNDSPTMATPIAPNTDVTGTIGASASDTGDRDLYLVTVTASSLRVTLSGIEDLNLVLEVLQNDGEKKLRRRVFLDDLGLGGGERVDALQVTPGEVYLRIEERPFITEPNRPPRERALVPYTLRVDELTAGGLEVEPNDTAAGAQPLPVTRAVQGFIGVDVGQTEKAMEAAGARRADAPFSSPDWFKVDEKDAVVVLVPPERGELEVTFDEPDARRPRVLHVEGAPVFLGPETWARSRRVRVMAGKDALPGEAYFVALATPGENGVAGVLDLAERLRDANRDGTRRAVLEGAAKLLASSPEVSRLTP
jgi:serine/threonine-protein kinase